MRKLRNISMPVFLERLRESYWLLPTILSLFIVALLPLMLSIEEKYFREHISQKLFAGYSSEAARLILSSICTALMTVIGVLFSITIVVIQQASNQYSPRIIETFIRARKSQIVLGFFIGTFVYGILLLRQIPTADEEGIKIPQSAVSVAVILSLICIGLLVHFIHFIAHSIKSTRIINSLLRETLHFLEQYQAFKTPAPPSASAMKDLPLAFSIRASAHGYFQNYLPQRLMKIFDDKKAHVTLVVRAGDYVHREDILAEVRTREEITGRKKKQIQKCFIIGPERTHAQDVRFGLRQLTDISLRGLSPGINDPTTAIEALNAAGVILSEWVKGPPAPGDVALSDNFVLSVPEPTLAELVDNSLSQVLRFSLNHPEVRKKVAEILHRLETVNRIPAEKGFLKSWEEFALDLRVEPLS